MNIYKLIAIAISLSIPALAEPLEEEWNATLKELAKVNHEFSLKERELRSEGKGSPELEAKAREAFGEFLKAMEAHPQLKSYLEKEKALKSELEAAIRDEDEKNRESAFMAMEKLKGEQFQAALKIPELKKLKETADSANQKARQELVKSDPEAQAMLTERQKLLDRLDELSAKISASE